MVNIQTKRPNIKNHIAIYFSQGIDSSIITNPCIKELLDLCGDYSFAMNFTYAIYTDHHMMNDNMFIPIFHPYYLNSDPKMVIVFDANCGDVLELYPYHRFYVYNNNESYTKLKDKFPNHYLQSITSLKDLL